VAHKNHYSYARSPDDRIAPTAQALAHTRHLGTPPGPRDGDSVLPILRKGMLVGRWLTSRLKGRELFIPRYLKEFGYAMGDK
jgi:hypothetical protein